MKKILKIPTISAPIKIGASICLIIILYQSNPCSAQKVISTAGKHFKGSNIWFNSTIGEPVIKNLYGSNIILTEGFHQTFPKSCDLGLIINTTGTCSGSNNGTADISVTGGTPPYSYSWTSGDTTEDITNLSSGTYTVTVTDSNSCIAIDSVTISINPTYSINTPDKTICNGDSIMIFNVYRKTAGTYYDSLTTVNSCDSVIATILIVNSLPVILVSPDPGVFCTAGIDSVTLTASGAVSYAWSPVAGLNTASGSSVNASPPNDTVYTVVGTDTNGCINFTTVSVQISTTLPVVIFSGSDTSICEGNTITFNNTSTDAIEFSWLLPGGTTADTTVQNPVVTYNTTGVFDVTLTAFGCSMDSTITKAGYITVNPIYNFTDPDIAICSNDSISIYGTFRSVAGTYYDSSSTINGCDSIHSTVLTVNPTYSITDPTIAICNGDSVSIYGTFKSTAATYYDSSTTINGCDSIHSTVLTVNPTYSINTPDKTICNGDSIMIFNVYRKTAGTYYDTLATVNNCDSIIATTLIVDPSPIVIITTFDENNCQGDGFALLTVSDGTTPYSYQWSNGATTKDLSGLSAGIYIVTVTDSNSCTAIDTAIVGGALPPTTSILPTGENGCGYNDGIAVLTVSGGALPYTYSWSNGATTKSVAGLASGTYTVIVTDSNGCLAYDTVVIGHPPSPTVSITGFNESTCDANDGMAAMIVSGGASPYTFSWSTGAATPTITGLAPGIYVGTVTDILGCSASDAVTIIEVPGPSITLTGIDESNCGANNGAVTSSVSGGATPYIYLWSSGDTTINITGLSAGTFSLTITDANTCTAIDSITLQEPPTFTLSIDSTTDATCGSNDGNATVTITGGTPPFTYSWTSGDTLATADSLTAGIYIITVTDATGCTNFAIATISNIGGATINTTSVTNLICFGSSNGSINITVTGGITPYTYSWSDGSTSEDISGLTAGPYEVNVTDDNGCVSTKSILVTQPEVLSLTVSETDANCGSSNGSATVSVTGGTSPYTFSWITGGTDSTETGLTAGVYAVIVSDANSCVALISAAISNIGGPTITTDLIENADCGVEIGAIYITVSGGTEPYAYLWSTGDTIQDLTGLPAGIYDITVTDSTNCLSTESFEITGVLPLLETICLVTVDSATGSNLVIWEKLQTQGVQSYNIYRESSQADNYYFLGNVPFDSLSIFVDTVSNPLQQAYRYKISVIDSCGNESELSAEHKTMHLTINQGLGGDINLIWDHYKGFDFLTYYIHRYSTSTGWVVIDSIASNLTSRTDFSPPPANLSYRIVVKHPTGCFPTQNKTLQYNSAKSNVTNRLGPTSINLQSSINNIQLKVYPNPNTGNFTLKINTPVTQNLQINITNILCQSVYTETLNNIKGSYKKQIDLNANPAGIYNLQLISGKEIINIKIIIE